MHIRHTNHIKHHSTIMDNISSNHDCHTKLTNLELSQEALETHEVQQTAARQADAEHELHDEKHGKWVCTLHAPITSGTPSQGSIRRKHTKHYTLTPSMTATQCIKKHIQG